MPYSFYECLFYFFLYAFLGWITEVIYAACCKGRFINRGFLLGPWCPIYGCGVVLVLCILEPLRQKPLLAFVLAVLITSALELLVGFVSEKIFHERLWDYSHRFLNIGGYICLRFSLLWGVACLAVVYGLQPLLALLVGVMPEVLGRLLLLALSVVMLTDLVATLSQSLRLEKRLRAFEEASRLLEEVSDAIGQGVSDTSLRVKESVAASERYRRLTDRKNIIHEHLFQAFERLKGGRYGAAYLKLSEARAKRTEEKESGKK